MNKPQISVVVPVFNSAEFISETIESVRDQSLDSWELILVDDGSSDQSLDIIESYASGDPRISFYIRDRDPKGPSACRNIGVQHSAGDYFLFLDADDLLSKNCLKDRLERMKAQIHLDFLVFKMERFKRIPGDLGIVSNVYANKGETYLKLYLEGSAPWQTPCTFWKKSFFIDTGGWDEDLQRITDPDMHTRALLQADVNFVVLLDVVPDCFYRIDHKPDARDRVWLQKSIQGRIRYYEKTLVLLNERFSEATERQKHLNYLSNGVKILFKDWLMSRARIFETEFKELMQWANSNAILNRRDRILIQTAFFLWRYDNLFIRIFKLKGLISGLIK